MIKYLPLYICMDEETGKIFIGTAKFPNRFDFDHAPAKYFIEAESVDELLKKAKEIIDPPKYIQ